MTEHVRRQRGNREQIQSSTVIAVCSISTMIEVNEHSSLLLTGRAWMHLMMKHNLRLVSRGSCLPEHLVLQHCFARWFYVVVLFLSMKALLHRLFAPSLLEHSSWLMCPRWVGSFKIYTPIYSWLVLNECLGFIFVHFSLGRNRRRLWVIMTWRGEGGGWGLRTNPGCHVYLPSGITLPSGLETQAEALRTDHL